MTFYLNYYMKYYFHRLFKQTSCIWYVVGIMEYNDSKREDTPSNQHKKTWGYLYWHSVCTSLLIYFPQNSVTTPEMFQIHLKKQGVNNTRHKGVKLSTVLWWSLWETSVQLNKSLNKKHDHITGFTS